MRDWTEYYEDTDFPDDHRDGAKVWNSAPLCDPRWDAFLKSTPLGQFQQSSLWAEFKAGEGWRHHRVLVTSEAGIVGGFQILWKNRGPIRIGYVSKGPVLLPQCSDLSRCMADLLAKAARDLRLTALIMQAPDASTFPSEAYRAEGFIESNPMQVLEATCVVDLTRDTAALRAEMSRSLRRNIRRAQKLGASIRNGTENDVQTFFSLMETTCTRLRTKPNPATGGAIARLWKIFSRENLLRLTFIKCGEFEPAAILCLSFGRRYTPWKKGWDGKQDEWHPNATLLDESISWAKAQGFGEFDFGSFDRAAAEEFSAGEPVSTEKLSSRDSFHHHFGAKPRLLPRAMILLPNPLLRWIYRHTYLRREQQTVRRNRNESSLRRAKTKAGRATL